MRLCHKTKFELFLLIDIIHLFCYFKSYFKAVLLTNAKSSVSQLYLLNEHGDLYFLLQILDHCIVGNNQGKFKKKIMSTFISRESP